MMTIVATVTLRQGSEPEWDAAIQERFAAAREQDGWVSAQLCIPIDRLDQRIIIGTWETRAHWEAWHDDPAFRESRERLEGLQEGPNDVQWHEVVVTGDAG